MSTTTIYGFNFLIPIGLSDYPIPFQQFHKGVDENGTNLGYYSYNEYMALPGNKAFYTPSNTHCILGTNITSVYDLAIKFTQYINNISPYTVIKEGVETTAWQDPAQDNYLWILSTEPSVDYNYDSFATQSPLFVEVKK